MESSISMNMKTVKASTTKPNGKTPSGDKYLGIEIYIRFYEIEDGDNTDEGKESEIIVIHNLSLMVSKQNLIRCKFPYIDTLYHERTTVICAMRNLTVRVFEHL